MSMLFLKLPVRDLAAARSFYEALGFRINEHSSDEHTAAVVVDDEFVVTLLTHESFGDLLAGERGDPGRPTAVPCLSVQLREEVDDLVSRAISSGGRPWQPAREDGNTYTGSFADPDGNVWQVTWLEQLHVIN